MTDQDVKRAKADWSRTEEALARLLTGKAPDDLHLELARIAAVEAKLRYEGLVAEAAEREGELWQ